MLFYGVFFQCSFCTFLMMMDLIGVLAFCQTVR